MTNLNFFAQIKLLSRLAFPLLVSQYIVALGGFFAMTMLMHDNINILPAAALIVVIQSMTILFCVSCLFSVGIKISHFLGTNNIDEITKVITNGFILALSLAFICFLFLQKIHFFLILFGQSKVLANLAQQYFNTFSYSLFPGLLLSLCNQIHVGSNRVKFLVSFNSLQIVLYLLFCIGLIFGKFGLPHLGLKGAGLATTLSMLILLIVRMTYILRNFEFFKLDFLTLKKSIDYQQTMQLIKLGIPIGVQNGFELVCNLIITFFIGWLGSTIYLSAQQVVSQFTSLFLLLPLCFAQAVSVVTSHIYAKKQTAASLLQPLKIGLITGTILLLPSFYLYVFYPNMLIHWYLGNKLIDAETISLIKMMFKFYIIIQILDSIRLMLGGFLRGIQFTTTPMSISFISYIGIIFPLSYFLCFILHELIVGLLISYIIGLIVSIILLTVSIGKFYLSDFQPRTIEQAS